MKKQKQKLILFVTLLLSVLFVLPHASATPLLTATKETEMEQKVKQYKADMTKPGKYRVILVFERDGVMLQEIITVTVLDDVHNKIYSVYANDVRLPVSYVSDFTLTDWVNAASLRVYNETDQQEEAILYVNTSYLENSVGSYEVFFGSENAAGSFIVTLYDQLADEEEETINVEESTTVIDLDSHSAIYHANEMFITTNAPDLFEEKQRFLFVISQIILGILTLTIIFLLTQLVLADKRLKEISSFFNK